MKLSESVDMIEQNVDKLPDDLRSAATTLVNAVKKGRLIFANKKIPSHEAVEMYDRIFEESDVFKEE